MFRIFENLVIYSARKWNENDYEIWTVSGANTVELVRYLNLMSSGNYVNNVAGGYANKT